MGVVYVAAIGVVYDVAAIGDYPSRTFHSGPPNRVNHSIAASTSPPIANSVNRTRFHKSRSIGPGPLANKSAAGVGIGSCGFVVIGIDLPGFVDGGCFGIGIPLDLILLSLRRDLRVELFDRLHGGGL
jgi:hypothetical protein